MYKDEYISAMRKVSAPAGLRERLVEAMESPPQQKPARRFPRAWAGVIAAAAALAIALPVWLGGVKMGGASAGGTVSTAAYAMDTTAAAQEAEAAPGEDAAEAGNGAAPLRRSSAFTNLPSPTPPRRFAYATATLAADSGAMPV